MWERIREKLAILADAAKYDVSCASSGSKRSNNNGLGNSTGMGICHSYTEDGRCVSLLKILLTNYCIYDCGYCTSRKSNDVKRVGFTVEEVVTLTINFYRRNYIEGLFLSSGIFKNPDYTMERLVRVAKLLRTHHNFNGYIHLKTIPGASNELIDEAARYADRLSVNIELPSEKSLKQLAPEKNYAAVFQPMTHIQHTAEAHALEKGKFKSAPMYAPAGQSTQMVIGASPETDRDIIKLASSLYDNYKLKRVYYSGYIPVSPDSRLPVIGSDVPRVRENRLYQADWLIRYYQFSADEILTEQEPFFDLKTDPKMSWAMRNPQFFPVDVNRADLKSILRIPGVGIKSAHKIIEARAFNKLRMEHLKKIGVIVSRAKYFMICAGDDRSSFHLNESSLRKKSPLFQENRFQSTLFQV
jgi:putative DNA modification/repair radical SAM protein